MSLPSHITDLPKTHHVFLLEILNETFPVRSNESNVDLTVFHHLLKVFTKVNLT